MSVPCSARKTAPVHRYARLPSPCRRFCTGRSRKLRCSPSSTAGTDRLRPPWPYHHPRLRVRRGPLRPGARGWKLPFIAVGMAISWHFSMVSGRILSIHRRFLPVLACDVQALPPVVRDYVPAEKGAKPVPEFVVKARNLRPLASRTSIW